MDFTLTEEQLKLQKLAHDYAKNELKPHAHERERITEPCREIPLGYS